MTNKSIEPSTNNILENSIITKLEFNSHKITLQKFFDFVKEHSIMISNHYQYWADGDYAIVLSGMHKFDNQIAREVILEFDGASANSKLNRIKCEYKNKLGLWVHGFIYKRPWYKGGDWF